jgi:hypothetical protein
VGTAVVAVVMLDLLEVTDWAGDWAVVDWAATAVEEAAVGLVAVDSVAVDSAAVEEAAVDSVAEVEVDLAVAAVDLAVAAVADSPQGSMPKRGLRPRCSRSIQRPPVLRHPKLRRIHQLCHLQHRRTAPSRPATIGWSCIARP